MNTTDLVSNLNISPKNKMYSKVKIVSVGESELNSSINIFNFEDVNSNIDIYSDNVVDNIGWGTTIYGNQKRSNLNILYRDEIQSVISIRAKNKMYSIVEISPPPTTTINNYSIKDSYVSKYAQTMNFGDIHTILINKEDYEAFIKFDISNIPDQSIILSANLKLYNSEQVDEPINIDVYSVDSDWEEDSITWKNKPNGVSKISSSVVDKVGYISFDIKNEIIKWYNKEIENNGLLLKSDNDQLIRFHSKESENNKVFVEIVFQNAYIYSFGKTSLNSNLNILYKTDLNSKLIIPVYDANRDLISNVEIFNPDTIKSTISVIRENLSSTISVVQNDVNEIKSSIIIVNKDINDLDSLIQISKENLESNIFVLYKDDLNSIIDVVRVHEDDIPSLLKINRDNIYSSLYINHINDIFSSISVAREDISDLISKLNISREEILSQIDVWGSNSINSLITVSRMGIDQITSSIFVDEIKYDLESNLIIPYKNKDDIVSLIEIASTKYDIESSLIVTIRYINEIECEIIVTDNKNNNSYVFIF